MTSSYYNPVAIHIGAGCLRELPRLAAGRRITLVGFPQAHDLGLIARIEALLPGQLSQVIEDVSPNPDVAELQALYEDFWRRADEHELIVALGGGSSIDTAKALMVGTASGRFAELLALLGEGRPFVPARRRPLIAIPTTAGTGSEVTPWATVWDRAQQKKYSLHLDCTWPEAALVDAELMLSMPRSVTISTGLDALSHALESIWNRNANPVSDSHAVSAVRDVFECLPLLSHDLGNLRLRSRMALAALKAGLAFSNTKTALAHSMSYELTLGQGVPHGIACSFSLPLVLGLAWGRQPDRDVVLQQIFGPDPGAAQQRLRGLLHGLEVGTEFADYGLSVAEGQALLRRSLDGPRGRNFIGAA